MVASDNDRYARGAGPRRQEYARPPRVARHNFLHGTAGLTVGCALAALTPCRSVFAVGNVVRAGQQAGEEHVQDIVDTALLAERVAVTFYYAGLSTPSIVQAIAAHSRAPGAGPSGEPVTVAAVRAALYQEHAHEMLFARLGGAPTARAFYFPASVFVDLGYTSRPGTFLWMLDHLETAVIGLYLAVIKRCGELGRRDLAVLAARILGVECEHRALYRMVSQDDPADNITLEVADFATVGAAAAAAALQPYLTGGFPGGLPRQMVLPSPAQIARILGSTMST